MSDFQHATPRPAETADAQDRPDRHNESRELTITQQHVVARDDNPGLLDDLQTISSDLRSATNRLKEAAERLRATTQEMLEVTYRLRDAAFALRDATAGLYDATLPLVDSRPLAIEGEFTVALDEDAVIREAYDAILDSLEVSPGTLPN